MASTPASGAPVLLSQSTDGRVWTVAINRPSRRNAVDRQTAERLSEALLSFEKDATACVCVLCGEGGTFCAGADLQAFDNELSPVEWNRPAPMGPSRMRFSKPLIAAIEGHAVAGGLELALLCDLRVAGDSAVLGVFCRRWGVPLIDGGTVRLPRVVGLGRALDLVLTGRAVDAREALSMGLVNRVVPAGSARAEAEALAAQLAALPQACLRLDRASVLEQQGLSELEALRSEFARLAAQPQLLDDASKGARLFASGQGRGGAPVARAGGALLGEGRLAAAPVSSSAAAVTRVHPPLRAVLFDVGGVLTDSPVLVIEEYAAARGLPSGKLNRMFAASEHWAQLETGTISLAEFTARFQAELDGLGLERVRVAELLAFFEHLPLRPAFVEAVRDAARRGLIVAAVTNNWRLEPHEQGQRNMRQAVHELFEGRVFESSVEGRRKPSPDFFHLVCRRLEVQPDECLLVDDIPANLASAAKLGMRTVRVPLRQAERALPELLAHFGSGHEDAVAALERESPRARL